MRIVVPVFLAALFLSISCTEVQEVIDPTALKTDYKTLPELFDIIADTSLRLGDMMKGEEYELAKKYAENLQIYARNLKRMVPKQRSTFDIERYDRLADSIANRAYVAQYYARTHMHIKGMHEVKYIYAYVKVLKTYLGPPRPDEGEHFQERLTFDPEDRLRAAGIKIPKKAEK